MSENEDRKSRRHVIGKVTSDRMHKTITVEVERLVRHPRYHKYMKRRTVYKAHDENGEARMGDTVELAECRPLSKTKFYRLVSVLRRAKSNLAAETTEMKS